MPKEERLSAVAKRRRLNGDVSGTNTPSINTSRPQSPVKDAVPVDAQILKTPEFSTTSASKRDENSFGALVSGNVVQFSNSREVERLGDASVRIRLSKGQTCHVSGRYALWIKNGSLEVCGARLDASLKLHYIYAPVTYEIPSMSALTSSVEAELLSQSGDVPTWTGVNHFESVLPSNDETSRSSFSILGYPTIAEADSTTATKASCADMCHDLLRHIARNEHKSIKRGAPVFLLCGKHLAGTSILSSYILNGITTAAQRSGKPLSNHNILLLDLDFDTPIFTLPGVVSLIHVTQPILGPSWAYPATFHSASQIGPARILKSFYVGRDDDIGFIHHQVDVLLEKFKEIQKSEYKQSIVIIKANNWFETTDSSKASRLARSLSPDFVVCFGTENGSNSAQLGRLIAAQVDAQVLAIAPPNVIKEPPLYTQHETMLQSYCSFSGYFRGFPSWSCLPLEIDSRYHRWLKFGNGLMVYSSGSVGKKQLNLCNEINALSGCIVAVIQAHTDIPNEYTDVAVNDEGQQDQEVGNIICGDFDCLGFAIVAGSDPKKTEIFLFTSIPQHVLDECNGSGKTIKLVVQRPSADGCFETGWVQLEAEAVAEDRKGLKSVYRRKLRVQYPGVRD